MNIVAAPLTRLSHSAPMRVRALLSCVAVMIVVCTGCGANTPTASRDSSSTTTADAFAPPADPALASAVAGYHRYIDEQLSELATTTGALVDAMRARRFGAARLLYPRARIHYERIEPAAEIWGTLDLAIDGRANDFVPASRFSGFHRLEQILWARTAAAPSLAEAVGSALLANIARLRRLAASTKYSTLELTSGATELLEEIEATKITGEEERYSHLDLVDIDANVVGCLQVIALLTPYLRAHAPELLQTITRGAAVVTAALRRLRADPGSDDSGYLSFTALGAEQTRTLSNDVEALAQPVAETTAATSR